MNDLRVLVVDDEPLAAEGHASYVQRVPGFEVAGVTGTVQETLRMLRGHEVDLVLLDLNLPDGNGLDIVRRIRAAGGTVDILPITAAREARLVRNAVALGVIGYLLKPFTFNDLRERLEAYQRFRLQLASDEVTTQRGVDAVFRDLRRPVEAPSVAPKGLVNEVLDEVIAALRASAPEGMSASEVAHGLDTSRVTARRYLQYLADQGRAIRSQRTGGSGRPEVIFTWHE
ncbi:response regulator [Propionimicrobium sp. PCR01-08-3]|uniref:response regulator n=1 Tax=Propionimicrobium sp. PCR01-08-3 TaxID=3052086 RepID=UPI00255C8000|nr:response regulator [Propionimicrobium sp. PCR01-08-3]WIY82157.1 response regulator [Propionimicrobium sp. PCR01-08-3]